MNLMILQLDCTQTNKRFVLSLRYNGRKIFLFVNATKIYQFKAKDSEIKDYTLCLGNISKDFSINNNKTEDLSLSMFSMITGINESKTLAKHI